MKYKEYSIPSTRSKYMYSGGKSVLNPDRISTYYVRGKSKKECVEILQANGLDNMSYYHFCQYALFWGTYINRPEHEGKGLWFTRDNYDKDLIPIWLEE